MKIHDYIVLSILIAADAILFWFRGCEMEPILFISWLGIIVVFLILMKNLDRKRKMRQEIRREIQRALTALMK